MKKKILPLVLTASICLSACSNSSGADSAPETTSEITSEATLETTETTESTELTEETTAAPTPTEEPLPEYTVGGDGYFSLIDEGYGTPVMTQEGGTCWVTAAATSMESAWLMRTGENISIDFMDVLEVAHAQQNGEGYVTQETVNPVDLGGWAWQVIEATSNGFGEYILYDATDYGDADMETMKDAIRTYGAMNVAINDMYTNRFRYFNGYLTLNDPNSDSFDHEVCIVGWDDNFPREYFVYEPSQDGAWLCQNTRGTSFGNDGFYWVSYDTPFREQTIYILSDEFDHVLAYDGGKENVIATEDSTTTANVFHEAGTLHAVGTYTNEPATELHIEIRDAQMNNVLYEQDAYYDIQGYHVITLDTPVEVTDYSIVITYSNSAPVEGEAWEDPNIIYYVTANAGESYVLVDGEWVDMASEDIGDILGIDFIPNNCCIKAIY